MDNENFKFMDVNKKRWEELVDHHYSGSVYDVKSFKEGRSTINPPERELMGDISGKKVLHLQCHFGMDSISLIREGAEEVVGIDFSERAVEVAQQLADELGVNARFMKSNVLLLDEIFKEYGGFDLVFTSYGTIVWLPDLSEWARIISRYLKPGGKFVIVDSHPFSHVFDDEGEEHKLVHRYRYFPSIKPDLYDVAGSYATSADIENSKEYIWTHSISEIINSLIASGLIIKGFYEYREISWQMFPFLVQGEDGWYRFPQEFEGKEIPLLFGLEAEKPMQLL